MADEAQRRDFAILGERWLFYDPEHGSYSYTVESTRNVDERLADTTVEYNSDSGKLLSFHAPERTARSVIDTWVIAIHFGAIREGGIAYRAFVSLFGVMVTLLSVTGVWIWLRKHKREARLRQAARSH